MKNFIRITTVSLALITGQQAHADEIMNKEWLLQQGNEYIKEAVINLELPVMAELERLVAPQSEDARSSVLVKNERQRIVPVKTSATE